MYKKVGKFFIQKPNRQLEWTPNDYEWGKRWAMTQSHPNDSEKTLWDYLQQYKDSTLIIHELNLRLNEQ